MRLRRLIVPALAAVLLCGAAAPAHPEDALGLWRENRSLAAEAALAATPKPYFVLDLERRRIVLKTRGMALFEMPILEEGLWGRRPAVGPTTVVRRDALVRPAVIPGNEKTDETLDQQLLELADMPASYRMGLLGDVDVEVLSAAEGRRARWRQRAWVWRWRLTRPLVTLRQRRERHEATTLFLILRPGDPQRLYWTLFEGLDGILIPPR